MKKLVLSFAVLVCVCVVFSGSLMAQVKFPAPSPAAKVMQTVGITDVTVEYSRPGVKKRTIWGGLVPYDKVWRTGANATTTVEFSTDVKIGGKDIKKGKYGVYTIPGKDEWTFILSSQNSGNPNYKEENDVVRVKAKPMEAKSHSEWMRIGVYPKSDSMGKVYLHWEKLKVGFKFEIETKKAVLAEIESKMNDWVTPFRAANFALDNDMTDKAKEFISASLKVKEVFWNMMAKTRILKKAGADKAKVAKTLAKAEALIDKLPNEGQKDFAKGQVADFKKGK